MVLFAAYSFVNDADTPFFGEDLLGVQSHSASSGTSYNREQYSQVVSESIKGELESGAFESVIADLQMLTEEKDGYVKSLYMTYQEGFWRGVMICKVPQANVTSFTFNARAIIEANGTVNYINISIETVDLQVEEEQTEYSTIDFDLKEAKPGDGKNRIIDSISGALPILTTGLVWIAEGLIIGLPLCFASLGLVLLINRGIVPVWRGTLKKRE